MSAWVLPGLAGLVWLAVRCRMADDALGVLMMFLLIIPAAVAGPLFWIVVIFVEWNQDLFK